MSANNMWFAARVKDKWYGWDLTAEEPALDQDNGACLVTPKVKRPVCQEGVKGQFAIASADDIQELEEELINNSALGYAEHGLTTQPYLAKDGFPIKVLV